MKLTKSWAASLMQRIKLVKCQGSTQMKTALTEVPVFLKALMNFCTFSPRLMGYHASLIVW